MRTRTIRETRKVPHTIDGRTVLIDEPYDVQVPIPPRDWDHLVLNAVLATVSVGLLVVIVWSTNAIGDLLAHDIATPVAYGAASAFSLGWIVCMALEWLARYDPARAKRPRTAGHLMLAADMAAVCIHGYRADSLVVGIAGALVSALAKGLYTLVLAHHATPLDPRTQQWVDIQRAEAGGRLAMVSVRRELTRADALVEAEEEALRTRPDADPDRPDQSADDPDADILPMAPGTLTTKDAVRTAWDAGFRDEEEIRRTASKALGKAISPDTVGRYVRALKVGA